MAYSNALAGREALLKTIILYATHHGAAEEAAAFLKTRLLDAKVVDIKKNREVDLLPYDAVIVGGSIHMGRIQSAVQKLLLKESEVLLSKRLGLYLCCMYEGDTARQQFAEAFPKDLRSHARATGLFGGKFDFDKMSFFERAVIKKVAAVT